MPPLWRIRDATLTNITNWREKRDNSHSPIYDFRACERLAHCANAKNIECEAMWLFLKNTHLVHPCTPHLGGTPLEISGTPWGVRFTRLTSTGLRLGLTQLILGTMFVGYRRLPGVDVQTYLTSLVFTYTSKKRLSENTILIIQILPKRVDQDLELPILLFETWSHVRRFLPH